MGFECRDSVVECSCPLPLFPPICDEICGRGVGWQRNQRTEDSPINPIRPICPICPITIIEQTRTPLFQKPRFSGPCRGPSPGCKSPTPTHKSALPPGISKQRKGANRPRLRPIGPTAFHRREQLEGIALMSCFVRTLETPRRRLPPWKPSHVASPCHKSVPTATQRSYVLQRAARTH